MIQDVLAVCEQGLEDFRSFDRVLPEQSLHIVLQALAHRMDVGGKAIVFFVDSSPFGVSVRVPAYTHRLRARSSYGGSSHGIFILANSQ